MKNRVVSGVIIFIGFMLSPASWWNDAFVNIPLSYLISTLISYFFPVHFSFLFVAAYWFTNVLGLWLMHFGGSNLSGDVKKSTISQIFTIILYSALIFLLAKYNLVKPILGSQ